MDSTIATHLQRIALLRERRSQYQHRVDCIEAEIWGLYHVVDTLRSSTSAVQPTMTLPASTTNKMLPTLLQRPTPEPVFCIPETDWAEQAARSEARKGKPEFRFANTTSVTK